MKKPSNTLPNDRLVREAERKLLTGLSRTSIFHMEKKGLFPKRRKLNPSGAGVCWLYSELMEWINSREVVNSQETK